MNDEVRQIIEKYNSQLEDLLIELKEVSFESGKIIELRNTLGNIKITLT